MLMRRVFAMLLTLILAAACGKPQPLTPELAYELIRKQAIDREPIYAEVPQRVTFGPASPKDDYDEKSLHTLANLEKAGLVVVTQSVDNDGTQIYKAKVTERGFPILGTVPSARGRAFRAKICEKKIERITSFVRHPSDPFVGSADIIWHYTKPTPLYEMFETKINKPLDHPFRSVVSIHNEKGLWQMDLVIRKADLQPGDGAVAPAEAEESMPAPATEPVTSTDQR